MLRKDHCLPLSAKFVFANWKRLDCWKKMIVEFPARQWKWHVLFDLLWLIESTGWQTCSISRSQVLSCSSCCSLSRLTSLNSLQRTLRCCTAVTVSSTCDTCCFLSAGVTSWPLASFTGSSSWSSRIWPSLSTWPAFVAIQVTMINFYIQ